MDYVGVIWGIYWDHEIEKKTGSYYFLVHGLPMGSKVDELWCFQKGRAAPKGTAYEVLANLE